MKKILVILTALMMTAAVGCGQIDDSADEEAAPAAPAETVTDDNKQDSFKEETADTSAADESDTSEVAEEAASESGPEDGVGTAENVSDGWLNEKNCAVIDDYQDSENDSYDKQVLYKMAELAAAQYNSIIDRNKQAYFDTVNIGGLIKSKGMTAALRNDLSYDDMPETEKEIYYAAIMLLNEQVDEEYTKIYEDYYNDKITRDEVANKTAEIIVSAADKVTADNAEELFDEYSTFNFLLSDKYERVPQQFKESPTEFRIEPANDMICSVEIDGYNSNEYGTFAELDILFASGEWEYILDECYLWLSDEGSFVYISDILVKENEVKGMTLDELFNRYETERRVKNSNAAAKTAYNAVAEFFADGETKGSSIDELIKSGSFGKMTSDDGLTIDDTVSVDDAKGDAAVEKALYECGFKGGSVYLGFNEVVDWSNFFVQYKDAQGNIGQYPNAVTSERIGKVKWRTYLPPEEDR